MAQAITGSQTLPAKPLAGGITATFSFYVANGYIGIVTGCCRYNLRITLPF